MVVPAVVVTSVTLVLISVVVVVPAVTVIVQIARLEVDSRQADR